MTRSVIRAGILSLGISALAASVPALADLNCEDLQSTYDREPQMAKEHGYYVTQDEAVNRGGVGNYVQVLPEKDNSVARACEKQMPGIAGVDLKDHPQTIYFSLGDATLSDPDFNRLDSIAMQLKSSPKERVKVEGFADTLGSPDANLILSQDRAESVGKYLESQGIPSEKVQVLAYGERKSQPTTGQHGNPQDRKVVISVG